MSETQEVQTAETAEPTRDLAVARPFTITKQDGEKLTFGVGNHKKVPLEIADHWYAKLHEAKDGEDPATSATSPVSERERSARVAAEDEAQRLRVISQKAVDENAAAQLEIATLKEQLETLQAENDGLRSQLEEEVEPSEDDVTVSRKGRKWFVAKAGERVGEFASKEAADAKAAELRKPQE